jgi:hypothetical protein
MITITHAEHLGVGRYEPYEGPTWTNVGRGWGFMRVAGLRWLKVRVFTSGSPVNQQHIFGGGGVSP